MCCGVDVELIHTPVGAAALTCPVQQSSSSWSTAGLMSGGFQLEELSDLLSDGGHTLHCPDNFLSSLLFSSTQSGFFFFPPHPYPLCSVSPFQLNNRIKYPSRASSNAGCWLKESFSASMCQSAGIGALVESIWHGGVELYYVCQGI